MPTPTVYDVHREGILDRISIAYRNEQYVADQLFPSLPVAKQSDFYYTFDRGSWFRSGVALRAPGTRAKRADYSLSTASYFCMPYALGKGVPDEVVRNADSPLRPSIEATEFVTDQLLLGKEIRVANLVTASGNWASASAKSGASQWSLPTSQPLLHIETAIDAVIQQIGRAPNTAVFSWDVWKALKHHPDILDKIKYTRASGVVVPGDFGEWFDLEKILVGKSIKDTSQEGATESRSYVWGDMFWVGYVPQTPGLMTPAAGYVMNWGGNVVETFREKQEKQNVYTAEHHTDEVITASEAGAVLADVV